MLPGHAPGEAVPLSGPTPEQIGRMHAHSSAWLQQAMDMPIGQAVFHGKARGVGDAGPPIPIPNPFGEPGHGEPLDPLLGVGPSGLQSAASSTPQLDPTLLRGGVHSVEHPDGSQTNYLHGRVSHVSAADRAARDKLEAEWANFRDTWQQKAEREHGKKVETGWEVPPPSPADVEWLTQTLSPHHKCGTCRHAVSIVLTMTNASGYGHHPFSKKFCNLLKGEQGENLEFGDSPVFFCSHYERRWSLWARAQLSRLESRVVGNGSRLARVLRVLREPEAVNGHTTRGNGVPS